MNTASAQKANTNPNNLEVNKGDQFIIALDISRSMENTDCPGGASRFQYCLETLKTFAREASKYDEDGISFYPFGGQVHAYRDLQPEQIDEKLKNIKLESFTNTHLAIEAAYKEHKEKGSEQTFLLIFTDGEPSDKEAVKQAIAKITNDVKDEKEFRIGFLTVGTRTPELSRFLTMLDDDLKGAKYDIVDVKEMDSVDFVAAVEGALMD